MKTEKLHSSNLFMRSLRLFKRSYQQMLRIAQPRIMKNIFFLHLPKCGGTTINHAIQDHYRKSEISHLDNSSCIKAADILKKDLDDYRRDLLQYFLLQENIRYVSGHFAYSKKAYQECGRQWHFVTVLRHPVKRWFSHYFYNKYHKDGHFGINEDLSTFVESKRAFMIGCLYVRNLTEGINWLDQHHVDMDKAVDTAIKALEGFSLIGCLEHLDVMKCQFKQIFGVRLDMPKSNINPLSKDQQHSQISDEIRSRVEEICKPDIEVYKYAMARISQE